MTVKFKLSVQNMYKLCNQFYILYIWIFFFVFAFFLFCSCFRICRVAINNTCTYTYIISQNSLQHSNNICKYVQHLWSSLYIDFFFPFLIVFFSFPILKYSVSKQLLYMYFTNTVHNIRKIYGNMYNICDQLYTLDILICFVFAWCFCFSFFLF